MAGPRIAREDIIKDVYFAQFVIKLIVEIVINKVVVGSGHGDAPKYVGEVVALCGTPGVPLLQCSCLSTAILGNFGVGTLQTRCIQSTSSCLAMLHC